MGSNQQARYTGIQAQVNQQQGGIGVANFQPMDLSGIAKTIESIDNHIVKVQDANRTVDYLTLTEQLKAVDQEESTFSSTIDKDGNLTLLDGTKQNYKDYLASSYEKKVQLVGDFKSKWKANRFQNDEMGVRIRSMQETMPIDRLKSEKAIELNLAQIRFGNATNELIVNTSIPLATRVRTWQEAFKQVPLNQEQASTVQQNAMNNFVKVASTDFENFNKEHISAIMESSHGNPNIQTEELTKFYESPEFLQKQKDLEDAFILMQEFPPTALVGKTLTQGLTTQEIDRKNAIIEQNNMQYQKNIDFMVKNTNGNIPLLTSVALSGNADMPALQVELKRINDLLKSPYVSQQDKMQLGESKKKLTDAINMGKEIQAKGILGVNPNNAKTPGVAVSILDSQENARKQQLEEQRRIEDKQLKIQDRITSIVANAQGGALTTAQAYNLSKTGVSIIDWAKSTGGLPVPKEELESWVIKYKDNPMELYKRWGVQKDSIGEVELISSYAKVAGISDMNEIRSIMNISENANKAFELIRLNRTTQQFDFQLQGKDKILYKNMTSQQILAETTGLLSPRVFHRTVLGKTIQDVGKENVFDKNSEKFSKVFQDKYLENRTAFSKELTSIAKQTTRKNAVIEYRLKTERLKLGVPPLKGVKIDPMTHGDWSMQSPQEIATLSSVSNILSQLGATVRATSGDRNKQYKKGVASEHLEGAKVGRHATDYKDEGSDANMQKSLYAIIVGTARMGNSPKFAGHKSLMFTYAKTIESGRDLPYLSKKQNQEARAILRKAGGVFDEGDKADSHFHASNIPSVSSTIKYLPLAVRNKIGGK